MNSLIFGVEVDGNNETVQTQDLSKNEDQDHTDEETGLLGCPSDTSITNNANGKACSKATEADRQTSTQVKEAPVRQTQIVS